MKRRPVYLLGFLLLLVSGAAFDGSSSLGQSFDQSASAQPATAYTLPPDVTALLQQIDSTPVSDADLQNVAFAAQNYFNQTFASQGGAGPEITTLVSEFANISSNTSTDTPANLGQLLQTAEPFYNRLLALGDTTDAEAMLQSVSGNATASDSWPQPPPMPDDPAYDPVAYAAWMEQTASPVTLGQLKQVFDFDGTIFAFGVTNSVAGGSSSIANTATVPGAASANSETDSTAISSTSATAASSPSLPIVIVVQSPVWDNTELALVVLTPLE